jgi:hypothetical protein
MLAFVLNNINLFQMNLLVISDYGITDIRGLSEVVLDDCIDLNSVQYVIYSAGYASIVPFALQHEKVKTETRIEM